MFSLDDNSLGRTAIVIIGAINMSTKQDITIILLVDNEPDNTSVLSMGLEDEGYRVDSFNDPMLALSSFRSIFYSLLILDINMPKMSGYCIMK